MPEKLNKTKSVKVPKKPIKSPKDIQAGPSNSESIVGERKLKKSEYIEAVGRRKRAVARVRLFTVNPSESMEAGL